jgi:hypothetical protein
MNSTRDLLVATKGYFSSPRRWTRFTMYRNARGESTNRDNATCACLIGACGIATAGRATAIQNEEFFRLTDALQAQTPLPLPKFNDDAEFLDVIALLDKAIDHEDQDRPQEPAQGPATA